MGDASGKEGTRSERTRNAFVEELSAARNEITVEYNEFWLSMDAHGTELEVEQALVQASFEDHETHSTKGQGSNSLTNHTEPDTEPSGGTYEDVGNSGLSGAAG